MITATDIRVGNILRIDGKACKVLSQEIRGTGKFGKTVHLRVKSLEDGNIHEKSLRAEDRADNIEAQHGKMQYLYRQGDEFYFMHMESFEQFSIPASAVGKQEVFLKENLEISVLLADGKPLSIEFPKTAELKVTSAPTGVKGGDSTYKEVELENGLKILAPQFIKEGETIRVNVEDLAYVDRVTTRTL